MAEVIVSTKTNQAAKAEPTTQARPKALLLIAAFKLLKALACLVLAAAAFHLLRPDVDAHFGHWLQSLTWATRHGIVARAIDWLIGLGPQQFRLFGAGALAYAALYFVQGFGLWFGKRWAEYLIVLETGLLLPVEVWEIWRRFAWLKIGILCINLAIVVYLIRVLRKPRPPRAA